MKRRIYALFASAIVFFAFAGSDQLGSGFILPGIDHLFLTRAAGIDLDVNGNIVLSIVQKSSGGGGKESSGGGGEGGGAEKPMIYTATGKTVDEALNNMEKFAALSIFFGHLDFILIGEKAMERDVAKYLDFFLRRIELGFNVDVYGVKGGSAKDLITNGNGANKLIFDKLQYLSTNSNLRFIASRVTFLKLVTQLDIKEMSPVLPCVIAQKTEELKDDPEEPTVVLAGYAILTREGKLLTYTDDSVSRGISFLNNEVKIGQYNLEQDTDTLTSVNLFSSQTEVKVTDKDSELKAKVTIFVSANVLESTGEIKGDKYGHFKQLENELNRKIKEEVEKAIQLAQKEKQDFIGLHAVVYRSMPKKWKEKYEKNWPEKFSKVPVEVEVQSNINIKFGVKEPSQTSKTEEE